MLRGGHDNLGWVSLRVFDKLTDVNFRIFNHLSVFGFSAAHF